MKNMLISALAASGLLFSVHASATEQVDFRAAINKGFVANSTPFTPPALPVLVSTTVYTNVDLSGRGSVTVLYQATDNTTGTRVFSQMVTINAGQTSVTVGKAKTGKVVLTYDPTTDKLTARFTLDLTVQQAMFGFTVSSTDYGTGYNTAATISSVQTE